MEGEQALIRTEDGSWSLRDLETGELFHNRTGAVTEALKNFVEPSGAVEVLRQTGSLSVLDACFGLGYNSWILIAEILASDIAAGTVRVLAIDRNSEILDRAISVLEDARLCGVKALFGASQAGASGRLDPGAENRWTAGLLTVRLQVRVGDLRELVPGLAAGFDLVFHDPFSPARMPELWTVDLFGQYHRLLAPSQGRVLTYSAATAVRAGLHAAGFTVWRTAAVGGKSGGTLACLDRGRPAGQEIYPLNAEEEGRLRSRSAVPYRDPSLAGTRESILGRRRDEQAAWT
jgi:hypothetical protein